MAIRPLVLAPLGQQRELGERDLDRHRHRETATPLPLRLSQGDLQPERVLGEIEQQTGGGAVGQALVGGLVEVALDGARAGAGAAHLHIDLVPGRRRPDAVEA